MRISPISFKSGIIKIENLRINPDTIKTYEPEMYGFRVNVQFLNGENKYLKIRTDIFEKAMLKAKNSNKIVDITKYAGKVFLDD